jgi:hypothetical protein
MRVPQNRILSYAAKHRYRRAEKRLGPKSKWKQQSNVFNLIETQIRALAGRKQLSALPPEVDFIPKWIVMPVVFRIL